MTKQLLLVFLGGGLGSMLRFMCSIWINSAQFKWLPTITVNLLGCFLLGAFLAGTHKNMMDSSLYILLGVGFCGGLTTFSTFSIDAYNLLKSHNYMEGLAYLGISILGGLIMTYIGYQTVKNYI